MKKNMRASAWMVLLLATSLMKANHAFGEELAGRVITIASEAGLKLPANLPPNVPWTSIPQVRAVEVPTSAYAETRDGFDRLQLPGEIVYTVKDKNGVSNIHRISANGRNERMLFHNTDAANSNCLLPMWSEDRARIYFTAMKDGQWKRWSMDSDGGNPAVLGSEESESGSRLSRTADILVEQGKVSYIDENSRKIEVYHFKRFDPKFNPGPSEASWGPGKKFIIFESCEYHGPFGTFGGCSIRVANRAGKTVKIVEGMEPDWK